MWFWNLNMDCGWDNDIISILNYLTMIIVRWLCRRMFSVLRKHTMKWLQNGHDVSDLVFNDSGRQIIYLHRSIYLSIYLEMKKRMIQQMGQNAMWVSLGKKHKGISCTILSTFLEAWKYNIIKISKKSAPSVEPIRFGVIIISFFFKNKT